jgi:hypothetical protein
MLAVANQVFDQHASGLPAVGPSYRQKSAPDGGTSGQSPNPASNMLTPASDNADLSHLSPRNTTLSSLSTSCPGSMRRLEHLVIPEENPSRITNDYNDDGSKDGDCDESDNGANGSDNLLIEDGIGEDDEDEEDDDMEDTDSPHLSRRLPIRPLPPWLKDAFNQRVEESKIRGQDGLPALYRDHKTFWFPRPSTFFLLKDQNLSPQQIYSYDMFLWDPMALVDGGIPCPNAGCRTPLWRNGHAPRPR